MLRQIVCLILFAMLLLRINKQTCSPAEVLQQERFLCTAKQFMHFDEKNHCPVYSLQPNYYRKMISDVSSRYDLAVVAPCCLLWILPHYPLKHSNHACCHMQRFSSDLRNTEFLFIFCYCQLVFCRPQDASYLKVFGFI